MTEAVLPFFVKGTVVRGFGRGSRDLGCPTANIASAVVDQVPLSNGIYCGFALLFGQLYQMSCSLGFNPQYGNSKKSLEVHLLPDTLDDFYGAELAIVIVGKLRDEQRFDSVDALRTAIAQDNADALHRLQSECEWRDVKDRLRSFST